jgi:hypothetical protein
VRKIQHFSFSGPDRSSLFMNERFRYGCVHSPLPLSELFEREDRRPRREKRSAIAETFSSTAREAARGFVSVESSTCKRPR